jgi:predicted metal-binding membrane protein
LTPGVALVPRMTNGGAFLTAAVLFAAVVLAWWRTAADAALMPCMVDGIARPGHVMPFDVGPARFVGMWTVMIAAMMLPGMIPAVAAWRPLAGVAAASGYLAVWTLTAPIAFAALIALNEIDRPNAWLNRIGGAVIAFAGVYQFAGWKRRHLERYGNPDQTRSAAAPFVMGLSHGVHCLGSSWVLMSVLLVVGVMNLPWMVAIGAICVGEKTLSRRVALTTTVGLVFVALGLAILIHPQTLDVIAGIGRHV